MSCFIHGIASAQTIDTSGEIVDIKGLDISSLAQTGVINWEHNVAQGPKGEKLIINIPSQIVGKIIKAKKIYSNQDCTDEGQLHFWNKIKLPFVYIIAELLDDYCENAKIVAGMFYYDHDHPNQKGILGFSVEGSELPKTRQGMVITRSIARCVTLTKAPANKACVAELYLGEEESRVKDDIDELFKSEKDAVELFKSGEGFELYGDYLAKKEIELKKGEKPKWSISGKNNNAVHFQHPEYGTVSIHKMPSGEFHVKHNGAEAGLLGMRPHFKDPDSAGTHAKNYMNALSNKKILDPKMHNRPSPSMMNKNENNLNKALTAGSYNAAPSTLTNGAAYQVESMSRSKKKTDWNKRAKEAYDIWPSKDKFEKFMKSRMPHLHDGEVRAIGRVIALGKSLDFEKALGQMAKAVHPAPDPKNPGTSNLGIAVREANVYKDPKNLARFKEKHPHLADPEKAFKWQEKEARDRAKDIIYNENEPKEKEPIKLGGKGKKRAKEQTVKIIPDSGKKIAASEKNSVKAFYKPKITIKAKK